MLALLIKSSLAILCLFAFYKAFLEKESFYSINRIYLLASLFLVFVIPFVSLPKLMDNQGFVNKTIQHFEKQGLTQIESENTQATEPYSQSSKQFLTDDLEGDKIINRNQEKDVVYWLTTMYFFGVAVLTLNLFYQIIALMIKVIKSTDKITDTDCTIINTNALGEPFSFIRYIFIDPTKYDHETYQQIIAHEKIHVKYLHSIDLLLAEITTIFLWFNPIAWLFRKEVEINIEYQTDGILIDKDFVERNAYQLNLVKVATLNKPLTITTNYNQSLIKKRILKMNSKKSREHTYWKYAFLAPLLFSMLVAFNKPYTNKTILADSNLEKEITLNSTNDAVKQYKSIYILIDETTKKDRLLKMENTLKEYGILFSLTDSKHVDGKLIQLAYNIDFPDVQQGLYATSDFPLILFKEVEKGHRGFYKTLPTEISEVGKSILEDNLNGLVIFHYDGSYEVNGSGSFQSH